MSFVITLFSSLRKILKILYYKFRQCIYQNGRIWNIFYTPVYNNNVQDILSNCTIHGSVEVLPHRRMNLHLHKAVNFTGEIFYRLNDIQAVKHDQSKMGASSEVPIFDWCNGHPTGWPFILWLGGLVSCGWRTCCVLEKGHNHNHISHNIIPISYIFGFPELSSAFCFSIYTLLFFYQNYSLRIRLLMPWKSFRSDIVPVF